MTIIAFFKTEKELDNLVAFTKDLDVSVKIFLDIVKPYPEINQYQIKSTPSLVLLDKDKEFCMKITGYMTDNKIDILKRYLFINKG